MSYSRLCSSSLDTLFDGKFLTAIWHRRFMFWLTSWNFNSPTARYFSASSCGMSTIPQEVCFEPYLQRNPFVMKELKSSCFTKPSKCSLLPASSHPPSPPVLPVPPSSQSPRPPTFCTVHVRGSDQFQCLCRSWEYMSGCLHSQLGGEIPSVPL